MAQICHIWATQHSPALGQTQPYSPPLPVMGGWHFLNNSKPACVLLPAEASSSSFTSSQHRSRVFASKEKIGPAQKRLRHSYEQVARALAPATSLTPNVGVHIVSDVGFSPPRLRTLSHISSTRPLRSRRMRSNSRS